MVRLIPDGERIELSLDFDASQKIQLWLALAAAHESFVTTYGDGVGRDTFLTHVVQTIADARDRGVKIYDPTASDGELNIAVMTSKTLYNFLANDQTGILRTHSRTLRFVEAFLSAKSWKSAVSFRRDSFVETLGATTSMQYSPPKREYPPSWSILGGNDSALFQFEASTTVIPGPMQARTVLVFAKNVKQEDFLLLRVLPIPHDLEYSRFEISGTDFSDWGEEPFTGIGTFSRDGLNCHLTSANVKIPLYLFIRPGSHSPLECAFVSYEAPGYLLPYNVLTPLDRDDILTYFDNLPWIV